MPCSLDRAWITTNKALLQTLSEFEKGSFYISQKYLSKSQKFLNNYQKYIRKVSVSLRNVSTQFSIPFLSQSSQHYLSELMVVSAKSSFNLRRILVSQHNISIKSFKNSKSSQQFINLEYDSTLMPILIFCCRKFGHFLGWRMKKIGKVQQERLRLSRAQHSYVKKKFLAKVGQLIGCFL